VGILIALLLDGQILLKLKHDAWVLCTDPTDSWSQWEELVTAEQSTATSNSTLLTSKLARVSLTLRTISLCDSEPCIQNQQELMKKCKHRKRSGRFMQESNTQQGHT
jgi:hypothetical protein